MLKVVHQIAALSEVSVKNWIGQPRMLSSTEFASGASHLNLSLTLYLVAEKYIVSYARVEPNFQMLTTAWLSQ